MHFLIKYQRELSYRYLYGRFNSKPLINMTMALNNAKSGRFYPKNPQKYSGDPNNIIYRSLLERNLMSYFDKNPNILKWASEEQI